MWLSWQQEKVYLSSFDFKTLPIYFWKIHKVSRKIRSLFMSYVPKTTRGHPLPSPNRVEKLNNLTLKKSVTLGGNQSSIWEIIIFQRQ